MYPVPTSLSPSRVEAYTSCPLAFRFASIEKLPEPPSVHTTRGTLVHRALELLFAAPPTERNAHTLGLALDATFEEYQDHPDLVGLGFDEAQLAHLRGECRTLTSNYLQMEDPTRVREVGLELRLEASVGELTLRGIIDRLELDDDGHLVVTDYKTGRAPSVNFERKSLAGVQFYSLLCQEVFGQRPAAVRLMYLKTGETITARPTEQSVRFLVTRTCAVWRAIERSCLTGDFRPSPSALCGTCSFQAWCPAFGGDPQRAAHDLGVAVA